MLLTSLQIQTRRRILRVIADNRLKQSLCFGNLLIKDI